MRRRGRRDQPLPEELLQQQQQVSSSSCCCSCCSCCCCSRVWYVCSPAFTCSALGAPVGSRVGEPARHMLLRVSLHLFSRRRRQVDAFCPVHRKETHAKAQEKIKGGSRCLHSTKHAHCRRAALRVLHACMHACMLY